MLAAITVLLLFQLAGEVIVIALALPIPGPVVGMLLLFGALLLRGSTPPSLAATAQGILAHLSLLYVPAGVGVMVYFGLLGHELIPIIITLIASTLVTMLVTAGAMLLIKRAIEAPATSKGWRAHGK